MRIGHNISALDAWRHLSATSKTLNNTIEKLSSGFRINKAADDAAGLAISEKMRNQITGLSMAMKNAQDGISLIQTAEGGLNEVHAILRRMRELAVQSTNDTNTDEDRAQIQQELDQLIEEIDRIGNSTEFNTKTLLNGAIGVNLSDDSDFFNAVETTSNTKSGVYPVSFTNIARRGVIHDANKYAGLTGLGASGVVKVNVNGVQVSLATSDNLNQVIAKINVKTSDTGVQALVGGNGGLVLRTTTWGSKANISVSGDAAVLQNLGLAGVSGSGTITLTDAGEDTVGNIDGKAAVGDGVYMQLVASDNAQGLKVQEIMNEDTASVTLTWATMWASEGAGGTLTIENALFINGHQVQASATASLKSLGSVVTFINQHQALFGVTAATSGGNLVLHSVASGPEAEITALQYTHAIGTGVNVVAAQTKSATNITINGITWSIALASADTAAHLAGAINVHAGSTGVVASYAANHIVLKTVGTSNMINITYVGTSAWGFGASGATNITIYGGFGDHEDHGTVAGITAVYGTAQVVGATYAATAATRTMTINGILVTITGLATIGEAVNMINAHVASTGVYAVASGAHIRFDSVEQGRGARIIISNVGTYVWGISSGTWYGTETLAGPQGNVTVDTENALKFHIGANKEQRIIVEINDMRANAIGQGVTNNKFENLEELKLIGASTRENAEDAIEIIDQAIKDVSTQRAKLGAYQNRLEHTIKNLGVGNENVTAAESRIRDADMAKQMMNFTKAQILMQTGTAMLAQANTTLQQVLQLFR